MAQEANSWDSGSIPGRDTPFDIPESSCLLSGLWLQPDGFLYNVEHRNVLKVQLFRRNRICQYQ